jgi:hypothetical protein
MKATGWPEVLSAELNAAIVPNSILTAAGQLRGRGPRGGGGDVKGEWNRILPAPAPLSHEPFPAA